MKYGIGLAMVTLLILGLVSLPAVQAADQEFGGKIERSYEDSVEWWAEPVRPKEGAPNILILLLDDVGFAQLGQSFGGLIETPNIDRLAKNGLRFNNFHTTALCSPSRATLMAGRYPHTIGLGSHALTAMGFPDKSSRMDLDLNEDGSVDLYFGPIPPAQGSEKNWVKTVPGEGWFTYFRFYAPTEPYFDKSWQLADIKKVR